MKNFNDNVSGIKIELKGKLSKEDLILNLINVLTKFDTFLDIDEFSNPKIYFNIYKDAKKQVLVKHCKKFDIQITEIKNLRMLYLFEYLFNDVERINKVEELEEDIKKLILKYDPRLLEDEQTTNLFYSFLEEQIKKFEDKFKKEN